MPRSSFATGVLAPNRNAELRASTAPLDSCFVLVTNANRRACLLVRNRPKWLRTLLSCNRSWRRTGESSRVRNNSTQGVILPWGPHECLWVLATAGASVGREPRGITAQRPRSRSEPGTDTPEARHHLKQP